MTLPSGHLKSEVDQEIHWRWGLTFREEQCHDNRFLFSIAWQFASMLSPHRRSVNLGLVDGNGSTRVTFHL